MPRFALALIVLLLAATPFATAGTPESPEMTDPAGDCGNAAGNEYIDVVSVWISDETTSDFRVNIALAKFLDAVAMGAGVTVQFSHQGVQFGVIGLYRGSSEGWYFGNALVDSAGVSEVRDSDGSFTPGEPAVLSIQFLKDNFPHGDSMDNELRDFYAATTDLKPLMPFFVAGQDPPFAPGSGSGELPCDEATSGATYTFQMGGHSAMMMEGGEGDDTTANTTAPTNGTSPAASGDERLIPQAAAGEKDTPAPGLALVLVALLAIALMRRR